MASSRRVSSIVGAITSAASLMLVSSIAVQPADAVDSDNLDIFVSSSTSGTVDGIGFADEDILRYNTRTDSWSMFFDGSDMGIGSSDVTGFHIAATEPSAVVHLTLEATRQLPGLATVNRADTITFTGQTGPDTSGTFTRHLDGSDVGLTSNSENIDALTGSDGQLVLSTAGSASVEDVNRDPLAGADEDLLALTSTSLGADSAGSFALLFDGSSFGLADRDLVAASIDPSGGDIYTTFLNGFTGPTADGGSLSTDRDDIARFRPGAQPGEGSFSLLFDGDRHRFGNEQIDGLHVQPATATQPTFADLSVTVNDDVATEVTPGQNVRYTVTVANRGPATATGVEVITEASTGLEPLAAGGCAEPGLGLRCALADIPAGQALQFTVDTSTANAVPGTLTFSATVSARTLDSDTGDNRASVDTTVVASDVPVDLPDLQPSSAGDKIFVSSTTGGTVDGIVFADEDILVYDGADDSWAMFFDGSDMGLGPTDVNGFHVVAAGPETIINLTLESNRNLRGLGSVSRSDVVTFSGSVGPDTTGVFSLLVDGSDLGLTSNSENIDALTARADDPVFSTLGTAQTDSPALVSYDEDLLALTATTLGPDTAGTLSLLFDGTDIGLDQGRDLVAASIAPDRDGFYGGVLNGFTSGSLSTDRDDVFRFSPADGLSLFFDGDLHRYGAEQIDGLHVVPAPPANVAPVAEPDDYRSAEGLVLAVPAAEGVLANDQDPEPRPGALTVTDFDRTSQLGAAVVVRADGSFSYDPTAVAAITALAAGETLVDQFDYTISDAESATAGATVTITIDGVDPITPPDGETDDDSGDESGDDDESGNGDESGNDQQQDGNGGPVANPDSAIVLEGGVLEVGPVQDLGFGHFGHNLGQFANPAGVDVTVDGRIVIADTDNHRIQICNPDGSECNAFGRFGRALGEFDYPADVAVTVDGRVVIADTNNHRIQICNLDGGECAAFGRFGRTVGLFDYPDTVALLKTGHIVVGDPGNHRMQTCSVDGACTVDPGLHVGTGPLGLVNGTALDGHGRIVMSDAVNHRIRIVGPAPLLANDSDPDGDPLTVVGFDVVSRLGATISVGPDGSYRYDPSTIDGSTELAECQTLIDSFSYRIEDGRGATATGTVTVTVVGRGPAGVGRGEVEVELEGEVEVELEVEVEAPSN